MAVYKNSMEVETCWSDLEATRQAVKRMEDHLCGLIEKDAWTGIPKPQRTNHPAMLFYNKRKAEAVPPAAVVEKSKPKTGK